MTGGAGGVVTIGVAVAIPEPWGSELQEYRTAIGDTTATQIPTHITLVPPTEVAADDLGAVQEHLRDAATRAGGFTVRLRGTGTFRPVSPVVFIQVARGIPACEQLEATVRRGVLERDLSFTYHPHVTVAHGLPEDALEQAFVELADYHAQFTVGEFSLYVQGDDEVWRPIRRYPLGDASQTFVSCGS